jgi:hypothetical protein
MQETGYSQVTELGCQLRRPERRIQRRGRGAESADGQESRDQCRAISGHQRHPVALAHAECGQPARRAVQRPLQRSIRQ